MLLQERFHFRHYLPHGNTTGENFTVLVRILSFLGKGGSLAGKGAE